MKRARICDCGWLTPLAFGAKAKTEEMAEIMSVVMARKHIERADIVLMVIDAIEGVVALDATIAGYAHEAGRSIIIVVNKWTRWRKTLTPRSSLKKACATR